jgi:uncharacterized membrane protein
MRSEEQVNKCIDAIFARVQQLEAEVAQLKGTPPSEAAYQAAAVSVIETIPGLQIEQKRHTTVTPGSNNTLESALGTRWIGRIGILAILFGVVFFLKYSFDNKLIGEAGRVMLGIFWGAAFIGIGEYLQKKKGLALYGQMLSAGGLGVLYLALYAAFALYHLIPAPLAMAAMVAVTTTGMTLSIRYATYSLAAIALLGGFLTPLMLSSGQNQPLTLFGYILVLDIGVLLLMRFRFWPSLVAASLAGTALLYIGWHAEYFTVGQRWTGFAIITLFFVFYTLYSLVSRVYSERAETRSDQIIIFGSAAFFLLAFISQQEFSSWTVKSFTLILAALEIGLAELIRRRAPAARLSVACFAAASVIVTVIATCVALEQHWILPALAAEMAAFCWIGLRLELPYLRRASYILGLLVLFRFADDVHLHLEPFQRFTPLLNSRFLTCAVAIAGFYCVCQWVARQPEKLDAGEKYVLETTFIISQILSLVLLSAEVHDFFRYRSPALHLDWTARHYAYQLSLSILWALYASLLIGFGIARRIRGARILGMLLLAITILKVFFIDLSSLQTLYRMVSFIVLGLLLLAVSYSYNRFKTTLFGEEP